MPVPLPSPVYSVSQPLRDELLTPISPMPTTFSPISMDDVVAAIGQNPTFQFDTSLYDHPEAPLMPSLDDARCGLNVLQEYMNLREPLNPFDYLCLEHLRERLAWNERPVNTGMEPEKTSQNGGLASSVAMLME